MASTWTQRDMPCLWERGFTNRRRDRFHEVRQCVEEANLVVAVSVASLTGTYSMPNEAIRWEMNLQQHEKKVN